MLVVYEDSCDTDNQEKKIVMLITKVRTITLLLREKKVTIYLQVITLRKSDK